MPTLYSKPRPAPYPFGSSINTRSFSAGSGFRFGFNGKEKQGEIGVDGYDFGARIYDGRIGKWFSVDPHVFKFFSISPYNYCYNNPNRFIDYNGNDGELSGSGTQDDPYLIKATYAYVKGTLDEIQIIALKAALDKYNKKDGFKVKNENDEYVYIKFQLGIIDLPEGTILSENEKGNLRFNEKYSYTDINNKTQSSLNFVMINNNSEKEIDDIDNLAFNEGFRDIYLNPNEINNVKLGAEQIIAIQEKSNCTYQKINEIMLDILISVFVHEIYHNLGGMHEDKQPSQKPIDEMAKIQTKVTNNKITTNDECGTTFSSNEISPSSKGAINLVNKSDNNDPNNRSGSTYTKK